MRCDSLSRLTFAAVDFESAGAAPGETDQPVQIGVVRVDGLFAEPEIWSSYLSVTHPVHWSASRVHGITTSMLADAPSFLSLWPRVRSMLENAVIVGHNLATERRFLRAFPGHGFGPWLDTLTLARETLPSLADYALGAVSETLGTVAETDLLVPGGHWHDALYDAAASLCLLRRIVRELALESSSLDALGSSLKTG